jgi:predicted dehydrogenase
MNPKSDLTRRQFIQSNLLAALAASAFPTLIPASALGQGGAVAPSERVGVGAIGVGDRGRDVLGGFLAQKNGQVLALCDVKKDALAKAKAQVDAQYKNQDCQTYGDFRQLLARKDIDAVLIASTDHWHVLHALAAVRAGKDVYVEKPLGLSLGQDLALQREVLKRKRMFQFGTQQRSDNKFRLACELVRNGHIGQLKHINLWAPGSTAGGSTTVVPPPPTVDYNFWLGPAPWREHTEDLTANSNWWFTSDFAVGFIAGWGIHPVDIALWGAGELATGTVELEGKGLFPKAGLHDTATDWEVDLKYSSGLTMKFTSTPGQGNMNERLGEEWSRKYGKLGGHGTVFEGTEGWILVERGRIVTRPERLIEIETAPDRLPDKLIHSPNHVGNLLAAVKTRQPTVSPVESAVQSDAFCHISDLAIRLGRKLTYDGKAGKIVDDKEANQRLHVRPLRKPWKL